MLQKNRFMAVMSELELSICMWCLDNIEVGMCKKLMNMWLLDVIELEREKCVS